MNTVLKRMCPVFALVLLLPGCMPANNDYDVLRSQVNQHDQILQQLNMQLSGVQPAQADTWSQVQAIRQEIATLRGQLDTMNQMGGAAGMADHLARQERALRLLETQLAMDLQLGQPVSPMGVPTYPTPAYPSTDLPVVDPYAPSTPGTITTPGTTTTTPGTPATPGTLDTAQALYDSGMNSFNNRRYEQSLRSFTDFTNSYPQHALVSNAWFWQGESHYQLKNYAAAALAYEKVIAEYPNSNKAPASYLKQGLSFALLDKKDAARERLNQLIEKFPRAPEATRARQEMQTYNL